MQFPSSAGAVGALGNDTSLLGIDISLPCPCAFKYWEALSSVTAGHVLHLIPRNRVSACPAQQNVVLPLGRCNRQLGNCMNIRRLRRKWRRMKPEAQRGIANATVAVLGVMVLAAGVYSITL